MHLASVAERPAYTGGLERGRDAHTFGVRVRTAAAIVLALVLAGVAPASAAGQYPDAVLGSGGLSGYWRLGDASGAAAAEASGRAAAGSYLGAPALGARGGLHADGDAAVRC